MISSLSSVNGEASPVRGEIFTRLLLVELDSNDQLLLFDSSGVELSSVGDERFNVMLFGRRSLTGRDECACGDATERLAMPDDGDSNDCARSLFTNSKLKPLGRERTFVCSLFASRLNELVLFVVSSRRKRRRSFNETSIGEYFTNGIDIDVGEGLDDDEHN